MASGGKTCVGAWFNRNASRWFRKMAALRAAAEAYKSHSDLCLVWVDADCEFANPVDERVVASWFAGTAVFYHKSKRPVLEAGVVGYNLAAGAEPILRWMLECYDSGNYRGLVRWDDSYVLQKAIEKNPDVPVADLASFVGENAQVIPYGPVGPYIVHAKGRHGRVLGIMK
jgi:hypothetical protein